MQVVVRGSLNITNYKHGNMAAIEARLSIFDANHIKQLAKITGQSHAHLINLNICPPILRIWISSAPSVIR